MIDKDTVSDSDVNHIEFLGPPGAGKSTIFSQLIELNRFFGGVKDSAIERKVMQKMDHKYRVLYKLLPSVLQQIVGDKLLRYRLGHDALERFVCKHPKFMSSLLTAMEKASYEPEKILTFLRLSAEQYQIGASTVRDGEILCIDEGFTQRALAILWRCSDTTFSLSEYFNSIPVPDIVVHIDAPTDVCISRQKKRGRVVVAKNWEVDNLRDIQAKLQDFSLQVRDYLSSKTSVISIKNTNTAEIAVRNIESEIIDYVRKER